MRICYVGKNNCGANMKLSNIINKIKRRAGVVIFSIFGLWVILNPVTFITLGGDVGYKVFTAIWTLVMAYLAISQMDRHWSQPDSDKEVSLSKFMKSESNSNQKAVIYAVLIFTVGNILSAVISG